MLNIKQFIKFILLVALVNFAHLGFTAPEVDDYFDYEDEGRLTVKLRGFGSITNGTQKGLPSPTSARGIISPQANDKLTTKGYGVEGSTELFFNDYLASELSLGFGAYKTKAANSVAYNYSDSATAAKKRDLYIMPLSLLLQYHIAPFGAISPYIGGGVHYSMLFTRSRDYKMSNAKGPVLQAGLDFVARDDTIVNIDVKKYIMQSKAKYKSSVTNQSLSSKVKLDPLVISVGIGYKF